IFTLMGLLDDGRPLNQGKSHFVFPLAQGTPGKQCGLAATGDYQPSLRSPWLSADVQFPILTIAGQQISL
uniref:hypothetical protein n=1 Tax=Thiolapillus sp. TaxID=2017437 RepID=UPI003AF9A536